MKKITKILSLTFICLLLSSCVKYNATMTINKDRSMDFSFISAIKSEYANQMQDSKEDYDKYKEEGYIVEEYVDKEYKGYKVSKHFVNIDDVSSDNVDTVKLTDNDDKFFNVKKGFFKNTYTAKLISNDTDDLNEKASMYENAGEEAQELLKSFDFKFNLILPYEVVTSNATSVSEDKKFLTWDLTKMKDSNIEFQFVLYNTNNIILAVGIVLIIIAIAIPVIIYLSKTKHRLYMFNEKRKNRKK